MLLATGALTALVILGGLVPGLGVDLVRPVADLAALRGNLPAVALPSLQMRGRPVPLSPPPAQSPPSSSAASSGGGRRPVGLTMLAAVAAIWSTAGTTTGCRLVRPADRRRRAPSTSAFRRLYAPRPGAPSVLLPLPGDDRRLARHDGQSRSVQFLRLLGNHEQLDPVSSSSFMRRRTEALREGFKYFMFNFTGASVMFLGIAMLGAQGGRFRLRQLRLRARHGLSLAGRFPGHDPCRPGNESRDVAGTHRLSNASGDRPTPVSG